MSTSPTTTTADGGHLLLHDPGHLQVEAELEVPHHGLRPLHLLPVTKEREALFYLPLQSVRGGKVQEMPTGKVKGWWCCVVLCGVRAVRGVQETDFALEKSFESDLDTRPFTTNLGCARSTYVVPKYKQVTIVWFFQIVLLDDELSQSGNEELFSDQDDDVIAGEMFTCLDVELKWMD
ncbi:hypothetical protein CDAR_405241 [Caerostris darwini]|uniref:Uncharacterized protein n=1 Tax=Caerostris darwini TaxID=1538125 RepID=A0AAV4QK87_9ARAC|nr:hypothetical protein CDAR_405241 [Caerostris darwini]